MKYDQIIKQTFLNASRQKKNIHVSCYIVDYDLTVICCLLKVQELLNSKDMEWGYFSPAESLLIVTDKIFSSTFKTQPQTIQFHNEKIHLITNSLNI